MFHRRNSTLITMLCLAATSLVLFQNCDPVENLTSSAKSTSSGSGNGSGGGGQPYDGKPFVVRGACDDGTLVRSRLVPVDGKYILYRENCETITPRLVEAASYDGNIRFDDQTYTMERPAIPLPGVVPWYVQLQGTLQDRPASLYIVDLYDTDALEIARLKDQGHTVICRISAGTREDWNPDAAAFPPETVGKTAGGGGEHWVDIRSMAVRDIMLARLDETKRRGCHGIDFDSVDGFVNTTGFPLTRNDQMEYNQYLAFAAHDRDLIMSLNNVPELAPLMSTIFDFAVAEECFAYGECDAYRSFIEAKKPVLVIEYGALSKDECAAAERGLYSLSYLNRALDGTRYETCE